MLQTLGRVVWMWIPILVVVVSLYMVGYILLRTSGDGRPAWQRLLHPSGGGLQEENGGLGDGVSPEK